MGRRIASSVTVAVAVVFALLFQAGGARAELSPGADSLSGVAVPEVMDDIAQALSEEGSAPTVSEFGTGPIDTELPDSGEVPAATSSSAGTLTMELPAEGEDVAAQSSSTALFDGTGDDTAIAVQSTTEGLRALVLIDSQESPERFDFPVGGDVAALRGTEGGGVEALNTDGRVISVAPAPWATDANGVSVPTRYEINGTTLTQVVDHANGSYAYPVVADPSWWWAVKCGSQIGLFLLQNGFAPAKIVKILRAGAKTFGTILKSKGSKAAAVTWLLYEVSGAKGVTDLVDNCWP